MTLLFELEVNLEISAFRPGGEERCVLLGGHIKVLIHLSTLSEFQFPHLFIRSITDAGDLGRIGPEVFGLRAREQQLVDAAERCRL